MKPFLQFAGKFASRVVSTMSVHNDATGISADLVPTTGPLARALTVQRNSEFNAELVNLAREAGVSIRTIAVLGSKSTANFSNSTLQRYLRGDRKNQLLPHEYQIRKFTQLGKASPADVELWVHAWRNLSAGRLPTGLRRYLVVNFSHFFIDFSEHEPVLLELRWKLTRSTLNSLLDAGIATMPTLLAVTAVSEITENMKSKGAPWAAQFAVGILGVLSTSAIFLASKQALRKRRHLKNNTVAVQTQPVG
ncbi:hypothetical protein ACIA8G_35175 [Lentzea sp. NPDC051213]|uniref:hypothetical protein n=1 Tax=Lentzea sp. NPDC051213 TaxID=3364126 RepID=UPI0037AD21B6